MAGLWYRTGSVAVTQSSKKITGTGTSWQTALNRPSKGNVFYGPDGKAYEIDYISSETELYLVDVYTGANASSQSYKIDVRGGTVPELSRQLSEHYAYMQGIIDALQSIVSGSGDVTITGPSGQTVTVPALANMLSKSGNLAGLTDKPTARGNLGLGDAATKNIGVAAGSVAAGDHIHESIITVDGDPNTYYPVKISGNGLRTGVSINRSVHDGGSWLGALRIGLRGQGYGWGGETPYIDYEFSQMWGGGVTSQGCLADVAVSGAEHGVYVWLLGGRQYFLNGENVGATVYLSGAVEVNGSSFPIKSTGPLAERTSGAALDGPQLFRGPIANNMPYWNGENLPVEKGTFTPVASGGTTPGSGVYNFQRGRYTKIGDLVWVRGSIEWSSHTGTGPLKISLPFTNQGNSVAAVANVLLYALSGANPSGIVLAYDSTLQIVDCSGSGSTAIPIKGSACTVTFDLFYQI